MKEIGFEDFKRNNGNPMVAVSADEREFYHIDQNSLGVIGTYSEEGDLTRVRGYLLRPSSFIENELRVHDSKSAEGKREEGKERAREKVESWMQSQ